MQRRKEYLEILVGFFLILILSDSRENFFYWAGTVKEFYILILAAYLFIDSRSFRPFNSYYVRFIPFFIVAYICLYNAPPDNLFDAFQKTLSYMLLIIVVPNYVQRAFLDRGKEFFEALISLATAILLIGFALKFLKPDMVTREFRFMGMLGNPNGLGIFSLLFFMIVRLATERFPGLLTRRNSIIVYSAIVLSIIQSGSRGSLFGLIIFLSFHYIYKRTAFFGTIIAILTLFSYEYISENIPLLAEKVGLGSYLRIETLAQGSGRFVAWNFCWEHIQQYYWLGRGFEYTNYLFNIPQYVIYLQSLGHQGNAHNSYLTLWLDTGLIGLILFTLGLVSGFLKASSKTRIALPIMFAAIFSSFFESWLTASLNPFTIQLYILVSFIASDVTFPPKAQIAVPV